MKTQAQLEVGTKVRIAIRNHRGYTNDLYKSIQGMEGVIVRKMELKSSSYDNAYLVEFDEETTANFNKIAVWKSGSDKMAWWTERKDFKVIQ